MIDVRLAVLVTLPNSISQKIKQTRKAKPRVYVMLNHVKRKVVATAESPDGNAKQDCYRNVWGVHQEHRRCHQSKQQEQDTLNPNESWALNVGHCCEPLPFLDCLQSQEER